MGRFSTPPGPRIDPSRRGRGHGPEATGIGTYFLHLDGAAEGRRRRIVWPDSPWGEAG